jgi:hypothetical protein
VIVHGGRYQHANQYGHKLCDRLIFHGRTGTTLVAVELKGGKNLKVRGAISQIQNGLHVAEGMILNAALADWVPLLLYSGRGVKIGHTQLPTILRTNPVLFRGKSRIVLKKDCGSSLGNILGQVGR